MLIRQVLQSMIEQEIKRLYILHGFQRRGWEVSCLMSFRPMRARRESLDFFFGSKINQDAVNFYSSHGFRVLDEETFPVGAEDHAALLMRRRLSRPAGPKRMRGHARKQSLAFT